MGFLDNLKNRKNRDEDKGVQCSTNAEEISDNISISNIRPNQVQIEYRKEKPSGQYYDTTRLIIDINPVQIAGSKPLYRCNVSWYDSNGRYILNRETGTIEPENADAYSSVLVELDMDKLYKDEKYGKAVMGLLLDRQRVQRYLSNRLKDNPDLRCGDYIGGIREKENGQLGKIFNLSVGKIRHESPEMRKLRDETKKAYEEER